MGNGYPADFGREGRGSGEDVFFQHGWSRLTMKRIFCLWFTVIVFMPCLLSPDARAYQSKLILPDLGIFEFREPSFSVLDPPINSASFNRIASELNRASDDGIGNASSQAPDTEPPAKKDFFILMIGASYWGNLHNIKPGPSVSNWENFGQFKAWGGNIELSWQRYVTRLLGYDLRVGIDFGLFFHQNEKHFDAVIQPYGNRIDVDLNSRGLYLTPNIRWLIGEKGSPRFYLGAGMGWYEVDFVEQLSDGMEANEYFDKDTIGGYFSAGLNFPWRRDNPDQAAFCLEGKIHFVNFGGLGNFAPGAGDLTGPIYMMQLGLSF